MEANFGFEAVQIGLGNIRRIRNDQIEARIAVRKEISGYELDVIVAAMANRVAMRNLKRFFRYIRRDNSRRRRVQSHRNRDRPRTGADIEGAGLAATRREKP